MSVAAVKACCPHLCLLYQLVVHTYAVLPDCLYLQLPEQLGFATGVCCSIYYLKCMSVVSAAPSSAITTGLLTPVFAGSTREVMWTSLSSSGSPYLSHT